jgi:thiol-disulfide isomerase/thioredoxin
VRRPVPGLLLILLPPLLLLAVACGAPDRTPAAQVAAPPPFADCAALTAPPPPPPPPPTAGASSGTVTAGPAPAGSGQALPDLRLPCFTGGAEVSLGTLRGPAVVNLWASWCQPCRQELPAFQRLAQRAGGRVHVVGVDTADRRDAAQSLAADLGLTFPALLDPDAKLRLALQRNALPLTLFVDGHGRVRYVDASGALDDTTLAGLVKRHLGVAVAS